MTKRDMPGRHIDPRTIKPKARPKPVPEPSPLEVACRYSDKEYVAAWLRSDNEIDARDREALAAMIERGQWVHKRGLKPNFRIRRAVHIAKSLAAVIRGNHKRLPNKAENELLNFIVDDMAEAGEPVEFETLKNKYRRSRKRR